jgi:hypothetical protein
MKASHNEKPFFVIPGNHFSKKKEKPEKKKKESCSDRRVRRGVKVSGRNFHLINQNKTKISSGTRRA